MMRRKPKAAAAPALGTTTATATTTTTPPVAASGELSDTARFLQSMQNPEIIERVRTTISNAHVFKLPPRQSASVGWRGADWKEKVWQGTVKVVERLDQTAVLLVDRTKGSIFAVCPIRDEGAVDRCVDSSRYFVLRIENANGRHMFIGLAFNERNDAFDFNTSLEDSKREREMEQQPVKTFTGPAKDYSIKEGEKIRVSIPKASLSHPSSGQKKSKATASPSFLKPCTKDTPRRTSPVQPDNTSTIDDTPPQDSSSSNNGGALGSFFSSTAENTDPFPSSAFGGTNFFARNDDESTGSRNPFFTNASSTTKKTFDPRNYKTEPTR